MPITYIFLALTAACVAGGLVFFFMRMKSAQFLDRMTAQFAQDKALLEERLNVANERLASLTAEARELEEQLRTGEGEGRQLAEALSAERERNRRIGEIEELLKQRELAAEQQFKRDREQAAKIAQLETMLQEERKTAAEKLALLSQARESLGEQFKVLANEILERQSTKFTDLNKERMEGLLKPLSERFGEFQKLVGETNEKNAAAGAALMQELARLQKLNTRLSDDAENLTKALKGESKTQGNWGELILERILEESGLSRGVEYEVQVSETAADGSRLQPDVIIRLPEGKSVILDAKVTLTAYERCVSATDDARHEAALKEHIQALRNHIRGLSEKDYQNLPGVETVDFVLMFVPIEPAFGLAVQVESNIFYEALRRNVVIVTPSTLLATLRTIAHIWRQERQNRNVDEIARLAGSMYDKFVAFVADLERVGKELEDAGKAHRQAVAKLSEGRGNLVKTAERIKALGAKTGKSLDANLVEDAGAADPPGLPEANPE